MKWSNFCLWKLIANEFIYTRGEVQGQMNLRSYCSLWNWNGYIIALYRFLPSYFYMFYPGWNVSSLIRLDLQLFSLNGKVESIYRKDEIETWNSLHVNKILIEVTASTRHIQEKKEKIFQFNVTNGNHLVIEMKALDVKRIYLAA